MKKVLQQIVLVLSKTPARSLFILYYKVTFKIIKYLLEEKNLKIWPRNSFYFNIINPGISDIDFTFFSTTKKGIDDYNKKICKLGSLKSLFPIIGEVNIYQKEDLILYKACGNYFELKRDPNLFYYINRDWDNNRIKQDALVFILRALWSDYLYLREFPYNRLHKWNFIFSSINNELNVDLNVGSNDLCVIVENLCCLYPSLREDFNSLPDFLMHRQSVKYRSIYLKLYPHYWLGDYYNHPEFENYIFSLGKFSKDSQSIVYSQISWEIWGIYSQIFYLKNIQGLQGHLKNLEKILNSLHRDTLQMKEDIQTLSSLLRDMSVGHFRS